MTESSDQCCAILGTSRCINSAITCSNHCNLHRPKATNLYNKYKALSDCVDKLDIHKAFPDVKEHIDYITQAYILLNKTFNARMKHRKYAFVPECYDSGHDYQFKRLKNLIQECEDILSNLYLIDIVQESSEESLSEESSELLEPLKQLDFTGSITQRIDKYRKQRQANEKDIDSWINKYIEANKVILERRRLLIAYIIKFIFELFDPYDPDEMMGLHAKSVLTFILTRELCSIGYFSKYFKPDRCQDKNCGCFVPHETRLGCPCALNTNTINEYFNLSNEQTLKMFYETLLLNKVKIEPLIGDVMELHDIHDDNVIFIKAQLSWYPKEKRLVLEENHTPTPMKASKVLALNRLKNKYHERKMLEMNQLNFYK